jgi:hypothetical protein
VGRSVRDANFALEREANRAREGPLSGNDRPLLVTTNHLFLKPEEWIGISAGFRALISPQLAPVPGPLTLSGALYCGLLPTFGASL